jgi:hypothetical protein
MLAAIAFLLAHTTKYIIQARHDVLLHRWYDV